MNTILFCAFLVVSVVLVQFNAQEFPAPSATFEASQYTKWQNEYKSSKKALIDVEFTDSTGSVGIHSYILIFLYS